MSNTELPDIPGFISYHFLTNRGLAGWWKSRFSTLEIESNYDTYRVIHNKLPFKGRNYDTLEEAIYHVRYEAITKFFGDEI